MMTSKKSIPGTIPPLSCKRKLKLTKQISEPAVQGKPLYWNCNNNHSDLKRDRSMSWSSLMIMTNSFEQLNVKSKEGPAVSQSSSCSDLSSQDPSSKTIRPKLLKKRLKSLNKKELKSFSQSFPTYDREKYNADGSLHATRCLPTLEVQWEQAKLARYLRTPRQDEDEKEDILSKQLFPIFKYQPKEETKPKPKL